MKARKWSGVRLPCVGLFGAAVLGILLGACAGAVPAWVFGVGAVGAAGMVLVRGAGWSGRMGSWGVVVAVVFAFAFHQVLTTRDSASARLAEWVADRDEPVRVELKVVSVPEPAMGANRWRFTGKVSGVEREGSGMDLACRILVRWAGDPPSLGDRLVVDGWMQNLEPSQNPGEFDPAQWYGLQGILSELRTSSAGVIERLGRDWMPLTGFASASRDWIGGVLSAGIEGTVELSVILGMTVGDTSGAPEPVKDAFRETGIFHLFSVSGLHVGMIAVIVGGLLRTFGVSMRTTVAILIPCVFAYAVVTGLKPASVRAATMISIAVAGMLIERRPVPLNSVGAAGLVILAWNPGDLFNPGFQLSFLVVASILIFALPAQRWLAARIEPDPFLPRQLIPKWKLGLIGVGQQFAGLLGVSVAAWVGSLPLTLLIFHLFSPIAIVMNLFAVPLAFLILSTAMMALAVGLVWLPVAAVINNFNWLLTWLLIVAAEFGAGVPGGAFYVDVLGWARPRTEVVVFDFRQGAAAVIRSEGKTWLIDAGSKGDAGFALVSFLRSRGVNRIDGIVLTHGDSRHIGGVGELMNLWPTGTIVRAAIGDRSSTRRRIEAIAADRGVPVRTVVAGERVGISRSSELRILFPPDGWEAAIADDKGLVLSLDAGGRRILFLADAGELTEAWLLENAREGIGADFVVKGEHESGDSGAEDFVRRVGAGAWIVSADRYPVAEQVSDEFVERVLKEGGRVHPLDKVGATTISSDHDGLKFFRAGPGESE